MIRERLLCFTPSKVFSLSRRQAWIGAFLFAAHFLFAFSPGPTCRPLCFDACAIPCSK